MVLIRSTLSAPSESERNYAQTIAGRLDRWLTDLSVPHDVGDDENARALLANARVAILGYNPNPPSRELTELKAFVKRGGKLIVFYSSEPELAGLLHLKMDKYLAADTAGGWSVIHFTEQAPPHLPPLVLQESKNIRLVYPADRTAKVIAYWETASGKRLDYPAWLQSDGGLWMTHILLDDGDTANKKQMLLGLIAAYDSSVWAPAASRCFERASTLGKFKDFFEAAQWLSERTDGTAGELRAKAALSHAETLHSELKELLNQRQYPDVVERSQGLRALLLEAYGAVQSPRAGEFRGVWNRFGAGLYPGDWNRTCRVLVADGITDIIPFMSSPVAANYPSRILSASDTLRGLGDQLQQCLDAAHKNGLKVHAWKICWKVDSATADVLKDLKRRGRLQVTDKGETIPWLCPSQPENVTLEKDSIREMVKHYGVDGVHLDYIRYNDAHTCFCPACRDAFARDTGHPLTPWPPPVDNWTKRKEYYRWRCGQITRFVRDVSVLARDIRPGVKISAAVFGKYPSCVEGVGQDWPLWLQNGYMDFVCPMNYTSDMTKFADYVRCQLSLPGAAGKVYPGLGVTALESRLDPIQVVDEISVLRKAKAPGFTLFELNRVLEKETLPILNLGMTRRP